MRLIFYANPRSGGCMSKVAENDAADLHPPTCYRLTDWRNRACRIKKGSLSRAGYESRPSRTR